MRTVVAFFLAWGLGFSALADSINLADLSTYKRATREAISAKAWECKQSDSSRFQKLNQSEAIEILNAAHSGWIDSSGAQPLLTFSHPQFSDYKAILRVTTSLDYRAVIFLEFDLNKTKSVNEGDLRAPRYVEREVTELSVRCRAAN